MINDTRLSSQEVRELNEALIRSAASEVISWAVRRFGDRVTLASSFGAEDVALIDILSKATASPRVFFLDTGRLHQQTYDLVDRVRAKYEIDIEVYFPQTEPIERLTRTKGTNSFYESVDNRKECCRIRKVEPLSRALTGVDAWITGLRRSQSLTRTALDKVEIDDAHGGILKINPLADWTEGDVWDYIRANAVPYNELHDQGFPSIGCAPCTRAVQPGEDLRAGRWWWESPEHKECGLHIKDGEVIRP
ncbi:MAG: phosphoadenylyl-sulfate reductase [Armatimonadetes bacterium]|nr:phosphoadenylyl-sulfate reductase [Armatimonadota bacterium]